MPRNMRIFCCLLWLLIAAPALAESQICDSNPQPVAQVKVNLNTATVEMLSTQLKGIGKAKAAAIVEWRETNGQFASLEDLDEVKGIGAGVIEKNKEKIIFKDE
jgi:competence protein ComEA